MAAAAEQELHRMGRRYTVALRMVVVTGVGVVALLRSPPGPFPLVLGLVLALTAWSVVFAALAARRWVVPVDTAVIAALCLTQSWTVPVDALGNSTNWVLAAVSVTAVAHQWHTTIPGGAAVTAVVTCAYVGGAALAAPAALAEVVPIGLWTFIEAALSRGLYLLVRAGARAADRSAVAGELARRQAAVAAARRADELDHLAALHDTAASTLLAVGSRMVDGSEPWLADQALRDLTVVSARPGVPAGQVNLTALLGGAVRQSPVRVDLLAPDAVRLPATAAVAIGQCVREALTNVFRHAGVDAATLTMRHENGLTAVEVADRGRGFDPELVSPHRRGLSMSIVERMRRAGGRAAVTSRPGAGTRICLEWPHG